MTAIVTGALCLNMTLVTVADTRSKQAVLYPVTKDPAAYRCLIGLPHGYGPLIDNEVFFLSDDGQLHGPFLAVDVEAGHHAGQMESNGLAADINCPELVHQHGTIWSKQ